MQHITEPSRSIPVLAETDVLVVGGGPAGLSAAIAAARAGARVTILERHGCFGGNITQAMVNSISWYRHEQTVEAGGLLREFERRAEAMGGCQQDPQSIGLLLDTEMFKVVADTMIQEAGVNPLLHCLAVSAILDGGTLQGVVTESKSGRAAVLAKRVIDASGDADIVALAGAPFRHAEGREAMEVTVNFACSGVDVAKFRRYIDEHHGYVPDWVKETSGKEDQHPLFWFSEPFKRAMAAGEMPENPYLESYWPGSYTDSGQVTNINAIHLAGFDPIDVQDLTHAEMQGRRQAVLAFKALQKYVPGFENAKISDFGGSVGTRSSRKIIGEYELTASDVKNEARFDDTIGICPEFLDAYNIVILPTTGRYFHVPYRAMLPQKVEQLLVAGRCIAGDMISHSATRGMVCCMATGQAAGVAAAVSIQEGATCRGVNIGHVQAMLERQGVRIR